MKQKSQSTRPWSPEEIERLAAEDAQKLQRDPAEAQEAARRRSPLLADLLAAEEEN